MFMPFLPDPILAVRGPLLNFADAAKPFARALGVTVQDLISLLDAQHSSVIPAKAGIQRR
jgi:hypothetical protein